MSARPGRDEAVTWPRRSSSTSVPKLVASWAEMAARSSPLG